MFHLLEYFRNNIKRFYMLVRQYVAKNIKQYNLRKFKILFSHCFLLHLYYLNWFSLLKNNKTILNIYNKGFFCHLNNHINYL